MSHPLSPNVILQQSNVRCPHVMIRGLLLPSRDFHLNRALIPAQSLTFEPGINPTPNIDMVEAAKYISWLGDHGGVIVERGAVLRGPGAGVLRRFPAAGADRRMVCFVGNPVGADGVALGI